MRITHLFITAALLLSACGNRETSDRSPTATVIAQVQSIFKKQPDATAQPAPPPLTRETLTTDIDVPVILVQVPSREAQASLGVVQESATTRTYLSADGISLTLQNGILSGTRGFGDDLMSSDHRGVLKNLRQGSGHHTRTLRHLDMVDQLQRTTLTCTVTSQGRQNITILGKAHRVLQRTETCTGAAEIITNTFLLERGEIVRSTQWVSPSVASILIDQVQ